MCPGTRDHEQIETNQIQLEGHDEIKMPSVPLDHAHSYESGGFQQQYLSYLIERVLWYLFNCEHYNTSGPGDDLSQSEQEAEWNAQANAMGVRRG